MAKKGWYYDGTIQTQTQDGVTNAPYPSIWYTGNYLSFYPPKFVVARKVVKDVIAAQTRIRMALAQFGPSGYTFVRDFNPSCSSVFGGGNWEQNRSTYVNDVNALDWGGGTPLSLALFDVGRYYHTPTLPWFGATWESTATGAESATSANQLAVCWSCQSSSVIMLTDGVPSLNDGNTLPPGPSSIADSDTGQVRGRRRRPASSAPRPPTAPAARTSPATDSYKNNLTKVAFYLHNYDLRGEAAGACGGNGATLDGKGMPGKQVLDLYTVGFGVRPTSRTPRASSATRRASAAASSSARTRPTCCATASPRCSPRSTTGRPRSASRPSPPSRPRPATRSSSRASTRPAIRHWAGHLYRYELYSEFVNACTPNGVGDLDCDGLCASVFLQDKDGRFIAEDGNGHFVRTDNNLPSCSETPRCVALGKAVRDPHQRAREPVVGRLRGAEGADVAEPLRLDGDGQHTATGSSPRRTRSCASSRRTLAADKLVPYLGLGTTGGVCAGIAQKISTANDDVTARSSGRASSSARRRSSGSSSGPTS